MERDMPRKPRMYLPETPSHVVQRGNNREACFFAETDHQFYLACLHDALQHYHVALHAYVLMTNHVHLLMSPTTAEGISKVMQSVGRRYVQYINTTYRRTGTLWEGRHKASLVQVEPYLLKCYRYIELNPVAANMVSHPSDYSWSSYPHHAQGTPNRLICDHVLYEQLGSTPPERQHAYRELFRYALDTGDIHAMHTSTQHETPLGNERFKNQIEITLGRKLKHTTRGRPRIKRLDPMITVEQER